MGVEMRTNEGQESECRVSHMFFADDCHRFAASKEEIKNMIEDTTEELRKRGLDGKRDQMVMMAWCFEEETEDVLFDHGDRQYRVKEVKALQAMGHKKLTQMSAMKFRMRKADKAL